MPNERLDINDSLFDVARKLSEGNPGALSVVTRLHDQAADIDRDCLLGAFGPLISLDSFNVYGDRIWMLFKDVCGESITATIGVLRAVQMGFVGRQVLDHAIDNRGDGLDVVDAIARVKAALPAFNLTSGVLAR